MDVIDVRFQVVVIRDAAFPEAMLPDASLASCDPHRRTILASGQSAAEARFDSRPSPRIVGIAVRQPPEAMQVIRQDDDRDHIERLCRTCNTERRTEIVDAIHQQASTPLQQIHGEEECPAWHGFSAISWHASACRRRDLADIGKSRIPVSEFPDSAPVCSTAQPRHHRARSSAPFSCGKSRLARMRRTKVRPMPGLWPWHRSHAAHLGAPYALVRISPAQFAGSIPCRTYRWNEECGHSRTVATCPCLTGLTWM